LHKYFNTTEFLTDHKQLLSELPKVIMPNISFHLKEVDRKLGIMQQTIVDLDTVAKASINNSQLFLSVADQLTQSFEELKFEAPDMMQTILHVLTFLNPVLTALSALGFLYLFFRLRVLTSAAILFTGARAMQTTTQQASSSTSPARRIWLPAAWSTTRTPIPNFTAPPFEFNPFTLANWQALEFQDNAFKKSVIAALVIILLLLCLFCFGKCFRLCMPCFRACKCRARQHLPTFKFAMSFTVLLAVGNGDSHCIVELLKIPYLMSDYDFIANEFVRSVTISKGYMPFVQVDWPDFTIKHRFAQLSFTLPPNIPVSFLQARQLRTILAEPHHILLYVRDQLGNIFLMPLRDSVWEHGMAPRDVIVHISDRPPLYPRLADAVAI
jgi:hypothetical protein